VGILTGLPPIVFVGRSVSVSVCPVGKLWKNGRLDLESRFWMLFGMVSRVSLGIAVLDGVYMPKGKWRIRGFFWSVGLSGVFSV